MNEEEDDDPGKRVGDTRTGEERRAKLAARLNVILSPDFHVLPHKDREEGLNYIIRRKSDGKKIPLILRFYNDGEVYYKLPRGITHTEESADKYLKSISDHNFLFMAVPTTSRIPESYCLKSLDYFRKTGFRLANSKGNENRVVFTIGFGGPPQNPSTFITHLINGDKAKLFGHHPNLVEAIRRLFS